MIEETQDFLVEERIVLSKYDGEPLPENEVERVHIVNGEIVTVEKIEDGKVVSVEGV